VAVLSSAPLNPTPAVPSAGQVRCPRSATLPLVGVPRLSRSLLSRAGVLGNSGKPRATRDSHRPRPQVRRPLRIAHRKVHGDAWAIMLLAVLFSLSKPMFYSPSNGSGDLKRGSALFAKLRIKPRAPSYWPPCLTHTDIAFQSDSLAPSCGALAHASLMTHVG